MNSTSETVSMEGRSTAACAVCGPVQPTHQLIRASFARRQTSIYRCKRCGFSWCSPIPASTSLSSGERSVTTDAGYTNALLLLSAERKRRYAEIAEARYKQYRATLQRDSFSLLEIGCGSCGLAPTFEALGIEYTGIDIDPRVIDAARRNRIVNASCADFLALPLDGRYDVICFSQVLEHITTPRRFVEKVRSLLRDSGIVHCDVPNHDSLSSTIHRLPLGQSRWGAIEYPHHLFAYNRRSLETLFSRDFRVRVFDATVDDSTWGQARNQTADLLSACSSLASRLHLGSLLVAYGGAQS